MMGLIVRASIGYLREDNAKEKKEGESRSVQRLRNPAILILVFITW